MMRPVTDSAPSAPSWASPNEMTPQNDDSTNGVDGTALGVQENGSRRHPALTSA